MSSVSWTESFRCFAIKKMKTNILFYAIWLFVVLQKSVWQIAVAVTANKKKCKKYGKNHKMNIFKIFTSNFKVWKCFWYHSYCTDTREGSKERKRKINAKTKKKKKKNNPFGDDTQSHSIKKKKTEKIINGTWVGFENGMRCKWNHSYRNVEK